MILPRWSIFAITFFVVPKAQLAPAQQNIRSFFLAQNCGIFSRREDQLGLSEAV
jgi:hypothetical protein